LFGNSSKTNAIGNNLLFLNMFMFLFFQGKVSVADMIAFSPSDVASTKYDGNHLLNELARFSPLY
jgi:hypothetical protein